MSATLLPSCVPAVRLPRPYDGVTVPARRSCAPPPLTAPTRRQEATCRPVGATDRVGIRTRARNCFARGSASRGLVATGPGATDVAPEQWTRRGRCRPGSAAGGTSRRAPSSLADAPSKCFRVSVHGSSLRPGAAPRTCASRPRRTVDAGPTGRRATLQDVAAVAGVSKATVSKALNGRDDVAGATRERVLAAVAELDYRPTTAGALLTQRRAVAVVFDLPASPYILKVLEGILAAATDARLDLVTRLAPDLGARRRRTVAREWIAEQRASGVVGIAGLTLSAPDALIDAAADVGIPFVMVDPVDTTNERMVSVASSNWAGARAAAEHLIALGHRRIGWIGGPEASGAAQDRFYGFNAAMDAAGLTVDPALVRADQFDVATGARHAHDLLTSADPPTALMAADDELAVGVLAAAHALGIRVPDDLSVTGFDDTSQAAWTTPPLTTVHQHLEGMGQMAVQALLTMAAGTWPASRHVELATSLTVRGSTGAAPATGTRRQDLVVDRSR
ncbi:substrate-binding domain-containing protein [Cellulomonas sp. zg-ZUI22]|nr:substrate-binding domain-containing protein [Cellulomonas sp. zg-ZUI22]